MQKINYWNNLANGSGGANGTDFVDKNTSLGITGTFIASGWANMIQNELSNLVTSAGFLLDGTDATQIEQAVKYWAIQSNQAFLLGSMDVKFSGAGTTTFNLNKESFAEVSSVFIDVTTAKSNDLTTVDDIYDATGTNIISITEIQNKHLYVLIDTAGNLKLHIVPDAEMESATNSTLYNPDLIKDRYSVTPIVWNSTKKGYYKSAQLIDYRILGHIFVNGSNQIDYYYELGSKWSYRGFELLSAGDLYLENKIKREHPQCFELDGSTIATLADDFPNLYDVLQSTTLPNTEDRFLRSILSGSARSIRDLQADAFQGHWHNTYNNTSGAQIGISSTASITITASLNSAYAVREPYTDGVNGTPRTADETRPINYALLIQGVKG